MNIPKQSLKDRSLRLIAPMFGALLLLLFGSFGAGAGQSDWVGDPQIGEARLISAVSATGDLATLPLGIEFTLARGWKIYWRTPGEAGLAPVLDLSASPTPDMRGEIRWPMPKRFDAFGFDNFGYENAVILPFDVTGHEIGAPVRITADMEALACADICVPLTGRLEMTLPDGKAVATSHAQPLAQFAAMVPRRADESGVSASGPSLRPVIVEARQTGLFLSFGLDIPAIVDVFVEGQEDVAFKAPEPVDGGFFMQAVPADRLDFGAAPVVLTISAPPQMAEVSVSVNAPESGVVVTGLSLRILAVALLGGLILNLMPCVLPVLALKLSSVIGAVGASRRELRLRFLAGAAGILCSFLILAFGLALLRLAGGTVGWGIQFQNPVFLVVMMSMLGIFALTLLDLVTIPVPRMAQRLAGGSGNGTGRPGYLGDFFAGMLATILATPCSAPFVGTAVAVALSGGMADLFGIFVALGIGLAAPWLMVALMPSLVAFLPRPGPWMPWLKRGLAVLLAGTMLWLGSVLASVLAVAPLSQNSTQWASWSPVAMEKELAEGHPVLVDVTADWCVTCKANKALVLDRAPVASALAAAVAADRLVLLRADWTRPDADIAAFLAENGRYGIPFNILIQPDGGPAVILPELLTVDAVMLALEKAGVTAK